MDLLFRYPVVYCVAAATILELYSLPDGSVSPMTSRNKYTSATTVVRSTAECIVGASPRLPSDPDLSRTFVSSHFLPVHAPSLCIRCPHVPTKVPILSDNYAYLLIDPVTGKTACVDPAEPEKVRRRLARMHHI